MLFILQIVRIIPAFFFNGSVVDIITPYGVKPVKLEPHRAARIRVPDFHTTLTFVFKQRHVSYPIVKLIEKPHINFAPLPLKVDISMTRVIEDPDKHFQPIGHRGSGSDKYRKEQHLPFIPENSIPSFNHAYELGAHWVDLDLTITSDNVVVIYHDFKVKDTPVWNLTWKQFKSHVEAPTKFESVFTKVNPNLHLAIEIKYPSVEEVKSEKLSSVPKMKPFVKKVIEIIQNKKNKRQVIVDSFAPDVLIYVKQISPDLDLFLNTEGVPNKFTDPRRNSLEKGIEFCLEHDLQGVVTDSETIISDPLLYTTRLHSLGLRLIVYFYRSFNKKTDYVQEMQKFDCAGIDGIVVEDIPQAHMAIKHETNCTYNYKEV